MITLNNYQRMNLSEFKVYMRDYNAKFTKLYRGEWIRWHRIYCGFDIETTTINDKSYMWVWQFSYLTDAGEQIVVKGRKWSEFEELIRFLTFRLALRHNTRIIIWIANMSFEFSFIKHRIGDIDELFAKRPSQPLLVRVGGIEFREALSISQGGLAYLAKTWTKTQKMTGDLDFSIIRNSLTPFADEKEETYTDNDVIILSEFSKRIFNEYMDTERYIPMTSTGILRHNLRVAAKASVDDPSHIYHWIKGLFPETKEDYLFIMEYLFRGGFVHSCFKKTDCILTDLESFDRKSSYPAAAFQDYYPVTKFEEVKLKSKEHLEYLCANFCVIMTVTFKGLKSKTDHSIESRSKCIELENPLLDNGRVHESDKMTVILTEVDFANYNDFYDWDKMKIHHIECAHRGSLPRYLLDRFYEWFEYKESIDEATNPQEYAISKTRINGHFGLCVTRLVFRNVIYELDEDMWNYDDVTKTYDEMIEQQVLSPYWGIYMVAHARRAELHLLKLLHLEVAYSDTDSHKLEYTDNVKQVIESYNESIMKRNREICDKYGYDYNILKRIGCFESETSGGKKGKILRFKTLGAKRYITEYEKKGFESTISGLRKDALDKYCKSKEIDPFVAFENEMKIPAEFTKKLTPILQNERHSDVVTDPYGNTEVMTELSSVYLKPTEFTLTVDKDYLKLIKFMLERMIKHGS